MYTVIGTSKNALTLAKPCFGEQSIKCLIKQFYKNYYIYIYLSIKNAIYNFLHCNVYSVNSMYSTLSTWNFNLFSMRLCEGIDSKNLRKDNSWESVVWLSTWVIYLSRQLCGSSSIYLLSGSCPWDGGDGLGSAALHGVLLMLPHHNLSDLVRTLSSS